MLQRVSWIHSVTNCLFHVAEFSTKRFVIRTGLMCVAIFLAESLPNFGPLMSLVGGTSTTMTAFMMPVIFFMYLNAIDKKMDEKVEEGENGNNGNANIGEDEAAKSNQIETVNQKANREHKSTRVTFME